jgi:hypothetical protein
MSDPNRSHLARLFAIVAIVLTWVACVGFIVAVGTEWYLAARKGLRYAPEAGRLNAAYDPFRIQHLSPFYLFFFPFEPERRLAMGNAVCSIGVEGFRGPAPAAAGGKKLAFLLGGSAAFGHGASSNETTITGYLNQLQDEYHFVNAGVPSWNSTQEMYRLTHEILKYQPHLVIAYNGANDVGILSRYARWGLDYPPGTPESFETLYAMVDDVRSGGRWSQLFATVFPLLTRQLRSYHMRSRGDGTAVREDAIENAVAEYVYNVQVMHDITTARRGRFIGIFQPIRSLHAHVPDAQRNHERLPIYRTFHARVIGPRRPAVEYHDFATYFDSLYAEVPSIEMDRGDEITPDTVFLDDVHLSDNGNRAIAEKILGLL